MHFSGEVCPKVDSDHLENMITSDPSSCPPICDEIGSSVEKEDYCEDDDSEEEYSIQRPAFSVSGEPDFDSGPPLDGLEYLRRVRYNFQSRLRDTAIHGYFSCSVIVYLRIFLANAGVAFA